jgi:hypothetical protein
MLKYIYVDTLQIKMLADRTVSDISNYAFGLYISNIVRSLVDSYVNVNGCYPEELVIPPNVYVEKYRNMKITQSQEFQLGVRM